MPKGVDGPGLAMLGVGSVLLYAGVKGYSMLAVIQNLVTGKPIATGVTPSPLVSADASTPTVSADANSATPGGTSGSGKPTGNQALAKQQAQAYGWDTGANWDDLVKLWTQESSWNNHADNPSSHAYGIPQALPYTKMPQAAWPESAGGHSDPNTQIAWGLSYIAQRYGNPTIAWAHEQANNWY